jgi:hypothetical protein
MVVREVYEIVTDSLSSIRRTASHDACSSWDMTRGRNCHTNHQRTPAMQILDRDACSV